MPLKTTDCNIGIAIGIVCLIVGYNLLPRLTAKFNWLPRTAKGQICLVSLFIAFVVVCFLVVG